MSEEMKPCPFCGGKAIRYEKNGNERNSYAKTVFYQCESCLAARGATGDYSKPGYADNSKVNQNALDAWNRRAPDPRDAVIADLKSQIAFMQKAVDAAGKDVKYFEAQRDAHAVVIEQCRVALELVSARDNMPGAIDEALAAIASLRQKGT